MYQRLSSIFHNRMIALVLVLMITSVMFLSLAFIEKSKIARADSAKVEFNSTWTAKKMLYVKPKGEHISGKISIPVGVSEWSVGGNTGSTSFNEKWTVDNYAYLSSGSTNEEKEMGCPGSDSEIRSDVYTVSNLPDTESFVNAKSIGNFGRNTTKLTPAGQYGWVCWTAGSVGGMNTAYFTGGSAIPTVWKVEGSYQTFTP